MRRILVISSVIGILAVTGAAVIVLASGSSVHPDTFYHAGGVMSILRHVIPFTFYHA